MRTVAERDAMRVVASASWVELSALGVDGDRAFLRFDVEEARWLQAVGIPAGMAEHERLAAQAEVPPDEPETVGPSPQAGEQIEGQTTIDEMIATG